MENLKEQCPHCGASMKIWEHILTPGLVNTLTMEMTIGKRNFRLMWHKQIYCSCQIIKN